LTINHRPQEPILLKVENQQPKTARLGSALIDWTADGNRLPFWILCYANQFQRPRPSQHLSHSVVICLRTL